VNLDRSRRKRILRLAAIAALAIAGSRFAIVASTLEVGWEAVVTQWQDALLGWLGYGHAYIGDKEPKEQAQFWLPEAERLRQKHSDSATVSMGAAWVLDSPGIGFLQHYGRQDDDLKAVPQFALRLDEESIAQAKTGFRDACVQHCLNYAACATELEPDDRRWWRMRALLLFEGDSLFSGQEFEPRDENWRSVLKECSQRDAENSLYDYLAAMQLWEESAQYDWPVDSNWPEDRTRLSIHSSSMFAEGERHFERAQSKHLLAIGEAGYPAITEFLGLSNLKKCDQLDVAISRLITFRQSLLIGKLWRWQNARADDAALRNDPERELKLRQQSLRLWEQAALPAETSALSMNTTWATVRQSNYEAVIELAEKHHALLSAAEVAALREREIARQREGAMLQTALHDLESQQSGQGKVHSPAAVIYVVVSRSACILLLFAGAAFLIAGILSRRPFEEVPSAAWPHWLAWIVGCGGTYVVLGLAPAEVIAYPTQTRFIVAGIWLLAAAIVAGAVWLVVSLLRRRKLRFGLVTLFAVMTGTAVLASMWPLMQIALSGIARRPPELWVHAKGWSDVDSEIWRTAMKISAGSWLWAAIQWLVHGGVYVGIALSLLIATLVFMRSASRRAGVAFISYWTRELRVRWAALLRFAGRSAGAAGLLSLMIYLAVGPSVLRSRENAFQYQMRYCRDPTAHYNAIIEAKELATTTPAGTEE
jgi:hypothetical protein